jgi:hypothetical protein
MRAAVVAGLAFVAQEVCTAGVLYNWVGYDNPGGPSALTAFLEVSDEAWLSGSVAYSFYGGSFWYTGVRGDPSSPILRMYLRAPAAGWREYRPRAGTGFPDEETLTWNLTFSGDDLIGSMSDSSDVVNFDTRSADGLWTFDRVCSYGNSVGGAPYCAGWGTLTAGSTGRWVLDRSTIPLPTPSTLALCALTLLMLRRKTLR